MLNKRCPNQFNITTFTMKYPQQAFTLIEMMITVAIIGILASIAYPSYQAQINGSREAEARAALVSLATVLSQYHLDNNTYVGATLGTGGIFSDQVPINSNATKTYNLAITAQTATTFAISATPVDNTLATYTLDDAGNKTSSDEKPW